jgi:5-methylcytosine-specific restriction endonuclease McrA
MKSIEIKGKHNKDKINKVNTPKRIDALKYSFSDDYYTYRRQIQLINQLFLNETIEHEKVIIQSINKKLIGYKNQDIHKNIFDINWIISLDGIIEKLVNSKLKCFYCTENCELLYKDCLAKRQWTLDRIDNTMGHNTDNVVICCLECNIKRGNMDSKRFKMGKEIKIVKKHF